MMFWVILVYMPLAIASKHYLRLTNAKIETYIGSEKQLVNINLDMTKSDLLVFNNYSACLWPDESSSTSASNLYQLCSSQASLFNDEASKTFKLNDTNTEFSYESDGLMGYGHEWGYDRFNIGNQTVENMPMAILNQSTSVYGLLGIGPPGNEFTMQQNYQYSNFPYKLKQEGVINKAMYSINALPFGMSEFLFGAINHAKYDGELETFHMVNQSLQFNTSSIIINDLIISNQTVTTIIDNNSYQLSFPPIIFNSIMDALNASTSSDNPDYFHTDATDGTFYLKLNHTIIPISFSQIIDDDGIISITKSPRGIILGRPFLSSAYIVVDLEDQIISIGRGVTPDTKDDIEVIGGDFNSTMSAMDSKKNSAGISQPSWWLIGIYAAWWIMWLQ